MIGELQERIESLKRERDACVLAHSYMSEDVCDVADFVGDSYALSVRAGSAPQGTIVMCGVRFMAETAKILCPDKRVLLVSPDAGCPMAEQLTPGEVEAERARHPGCAVAAYVNTTAALKAAADVCVTSSSAVRICREIPERDILFIPDRNLGAYVRGQVPEKNFFFMNGGCPVHLRLTMSDVERVREAHPGALLLVHPECTPDVCAAADFIGSTAEIQEYAERSEGKEYIIGTETSIVEHLRMRCPGKRFYPASKRLLCQNMRLTTLPDVLDCLLGEAGEEIELDESVREGAARAIENMIRYGG